jgi:hypothetical protein
MNKAIVGHRSANEAVVLRGSKLARYRHDGASVVVDWEVECPAKMIDCDLACTFVDAVVTLEEQYGLASWSWQTGEPIFTHPIPDFTEPWALATSADGEWAAIAPIENQGWLVHRATGRLGARSNYGGDGCHAVSWSADGLRIGYGAGAIGGTGGCYVLSAAPESEVMPPIAKYKFSPYDSFYSILLNRDGSLALAYIGYGSPEPYTVGELTLYDVASGEARWTKTLDLDVLGVEKGQHEGLLEPILTEDSIWFGTRGKVVVIELESGDARADVPLGVDACIEQFALAAGGEWLWYLHDGQVGAVRLADAMVAREVPALPKAARNPELERQVRDEGDDGVLRAYAGWLTEQGDERGKLIELENGFIPPDPEEAEALKQRFMGELSPPGRCQAFETEGYFERGLLRALKATQVHWFSYRAASDLAFLVAREHLLFVETLFLDPDARDTAALFGSLRDTAMGPSLRQLVLQRRASPLFTDASWAELYPRFPGLRYIDLSGRVQGLGPVEQVRLEGLTLRLIYLEPGALASLIRAPWPLRQLFLEFGGGPAKGDQLTPELFQPLFDGALPRLEDLTLCVTNKEFIVRWIDLALESTLFDRLQLLGLNFDYVPEEHRQRLSSRGVRLVDAPHTPRFCDRIQLSAADPLLRMVPRQHVRELFEAAPEADS